MSNSEIVLPTHRVARRDDGIIVIEQFEQEQTLADAEASVRAMLKLNGGRPAPVLVDIRKGPRVSTEIQNYYGSEEVGGMLKAQALLMGNAMTRMLGNFFLGLRRAKTPVKLFTSEAEAIEWLKTFL
jgi:hypothetical protein